MKPLSPHAPDCPVLVWHGCYEESWKGFITDASFAHPAKMSRALLRRIIAHGFERQWWAPGSIIGEPFGGIGTTAIEGTYAGLRVVSNELEPKFCGLAAANIERHRYGWEQMGRTLPLFHQGDSRQFDSIVARLFEAFPAWRAVDAALTSPPFNTREDGQGIAATGETTGSPLGRSIMAGSITSPPYEVIAAGAGGLNHKEAAPGQQGGRKNGVSQDVDQRYGKAEGQIAGTASGPLEAAITSPPYEKGLGKGGRREATEIDKEKGLDAMCTERYGKEAGQIENCSAGTIDASVTSPPWEAGAEGHIGAKKWGDPKLAAAKMAASTSSKAHSNSAAARERQFERDKDKTYGDSEGQVGKMKRETYWQAMRAVYEALYRALKPGGVAAIVVKDYVRDKRRVALCDDTLRLLCWIGFEPVERIRAMVVQETRTAAKDDLFGVETTKRKEKKSFFRRLHEATMAADDPRRIDFEEVLCVRKPA